MTRALRDCLAGKHKIYEHDTADVLAHNRKVEVDDAKIASMVANPERFAESPPLIFACEQGKAWLIDGHHRLRALHLLEQARFVAYVIEEKDAAPYRVYFNGKRVAPWHSKTLAKRGNRT